MCLSLWGESFNFEVKFEFCLKTLKEPGAFITQITNSDKELPVSSNCLQTQNDLWDQKYVNSFILLSLSVTFSTDLGDLVWRKAKLETARNYHWWKLQLFMFIIIILTSKMMVFKRRYTIGIWTDYVLLLDWWGILKKFLCVPNPTITLQCFSLD